MHMRTGLGTHIVDHLLQGQCKMFSREPVYRGKSCAPSRFGKTLKNVQARAAYLSSFHSSERNAWRPGRRENGGWVRRLKTSEFLPVVEHPLRHTHEPLLRLKSPEHSLLTADLSSASCIGGKHKQLDLNFTFGSCLLTVELLFLHTAAGNCCENNSNNEKYGADMRFRRKIIPRQF